LNTYSRLTIRFNRWFRKTCYDISTIPVTAVIVFLVFIVVVKKKAILSTQQTPAVYKTTNEHHLSEDEMKNVT